MMRRGGFLILAALLFFGGAWVPSVVEADINVYDADGKYLGILAGMPADRGHTHVDLRVFVPSLGRFTRLGVHPVDPTSVGMVPLSVFLYAQEGCGGTAYARSALVTWPSFLRLPDQEGYVETGELGEITAVSRRVRMNSYECEPHDESNVMVTELVPIAALPAPFDGPLSMPLQFKKQNRVVVIPLE